MGLHGKNGTVQTTFKRCGRHHVSTTRTITNKIKKKKKEIIKMGGHHPGMAGARGPSVVRPLANRHLERFVVRFVRHNSPLLPPSLEQTELKPY